MKLEELFDVAVDGEEIETLGLQGKPAPDILLEAAKQLGISPDRIAVIEGSASGVQAGVAGKFKRVIGIDRTGAGLDLMQYGADVVVVALAPKLPSFKRLKGKSMCWMTSMSLLTK